MSLNGEQYGNNDSQTHLAGEEYALGQEKRSSLAQVVLFAMLLMSYLYFLPRWADWSQDSRLDLTLAIVDEHTLSIDNYYENTGDYALFNGRHYLDKAPGPSLMAVPIYAAIKPVLQSAPIKGILQRMANQPAFESTLRAGGTGLLEVKVYRAVLLYILTAMLVALPSAALGVLLFRVLGIFALSTGWRAVIVLTYGLATSAFAYSGAFYSHQISAFLLFCAFYIAMRPSITRRKWLSPYLVGLMIGLAMISEYPTALIGGALFVFCVLRKRSLEERFAIVLGGLGPGLVLSAYDWAIFGTILPVGYEYSALYQNLHSIGLISLTYPHADAMWGITFGSFRGLFFLSPVLLLAVLGFVSWGLRGANRGVFWLSAFSCLSFFLFNGSSAMWQGGFAVGPRYLVPMLPFLALGLGSFVQTAGHLRPVRWLFGILGVYSLVVTWLETISGQGYPDWTLNPLVNYSLPKFMKGDIARNLGMLIKVEGIASLLPLLALLVIGATVLISALHHPLAQEGTPALRMPADSR